MALVKTSLGAKLASSKLATSAPAATAVGDKSAASRRSQDRTRVRQQKAASLPVETLEAGSSAPPIR